VQLEVDGDFVAQYPAMNRAGGWEVMAHPDGNLIDPKSDKRYAYLFWEATRSRPFEIDPARAYLVQRDQVESFLDRVAAAYALTDRERTDFASYWIAALGNNPFSIVQLVDPAEYGKYAQMRISPEPTTTIRLFMVFKEATGHEAVGNPSLPQLERRGFTVVVWGGANLDERVG
jgi:hypothetical protein